MGAWKKASFVKLVIAIIFLPIACNIYLREVNNFLYQFVPPADGNHEPHHNPQQQQQRASETVVKPIREKKPDSSISDAEPGPGPLTSVGIWIDLPNAFPWRHCLQEYNNLLTPLGCALGIWLVGNIGRWQGSLLRPLVACYLAAAYYIYTYTSTQDRGHHVRDGITDWGQYPK